MTQTHSNFSGFAERTGVIWGVLLDDAPALLKNTPMSPFPAFETFVTFVVGAMDDVQVSEAEMRQLSHFDAV